jgi:hypothetical protein
MSSERVIVEAIKVAQVVLCQNVPPAQRRPSRCARSSAYFPITHRLERVALSDSSGAILLYRALINPDIPGMAFNGYNGIGLPACGRGRCDVAFAIHRGPREIASAHRDDGAIRQELELRKRLLSTKIGEAIHPPRSSRLPRSHRAHHRRGLNDTSDRPLRLDEREAHLEQSSP